MAVIFVLLFPSLFGFFTVLNLLFPTRVSKTRSIIGQLQGRSFWIGFVNILFLVPVCLLLFSLGDITTGPLKVVIMIPSLFLLAVLLGISSFGLLTLVNVIGERIMPNQHLWKQTFWGTILLCLACALPFVGWFLLLPYVLILGAGAVILSYFQHGK
jgi:hypothetical protein